jgi:AraC family transcriptional activator of tynA and feaB
MLPVEVLCTSAVPRSQRVAYWNDIARRTLTMLDAEPLDASDFSGQIRHASFGDIRLAELRADASRVYHRRAHITHAADESCLLQVQLSGRSLNKQDGREVWLTPGDFTLRDCTRPYEVHVNEPVSMLALRIPGAMFRRYVAHPENLAAVAVSGASGPGGLVSRFVRDLWSKLETLPNAEFAARLVPPLLELIAAAYLTVPQAKAHRSPLTATRRLQIMNYIDSRLDDPELSPQTLAARFRISTRYLHRLFEPDLETPAKYILRRRLEACARALSSALHLDRSITFIAYQNGFNSLAHFSKVFRDEYGVSPGDYRRGLRENTTATLRKGAPCR